MAITIQLPQELEMQLRAQDPRLDDRARDEFLLAEYRDEKISTSDVAEELKLETRQQAEQWLAARGANQNYSMDDLEADRRTLDRLLGPLPCSDR